MAQAPSNSSPGWSWQGATPTFQSRLKSKAFISTAVLRPSCNRTPNTSRAFYVAGSKEMQEEAEKVSRVTEVGEGFYLDAITPSRWVVLQGSSCSRILHSFRQILTTCTCEVLPGTKRILGGCQEGKCGRKNQTRRFALELQQGASSRLALPLTQKKCLQEAVGRDFLLHLSTGRAGFRGGLPDPHRVKTSRELSKSGVPGFGLTGFSTAQR